MSYTDELIDALRAAQLAEALNKAFASKPSSQTITISHDEEQFEETRMEMDILSRLSEHDLPPNIFKRRL